MTSKLTILSTIVLLSALSFGCAGSMRHVRHAGGGEIAFTGGALPDMSSAHVVMLDHCGGRFRVIEESEAMSLAMIDAPAGKAGESDTVGGRRVHYVCVTRSASAVGVP